MDKSSATQNNDGAIRELSRRLTEVNEELEAEKKKGLMILDEVTMEELRKNEMKRADELMVETSSSSSFLAINSIRPARRDEGGSTSIILMDFLWILGLGTIKEAVTFITLELQVRIRKQVTADSGVPPIRCPYPSRLINFEQGIFLSSPRNRSSSPYRL
ncbi:hypothetical protein NE237_025515 [Protea cynaroides]|uniref:Uncharacterized protein n=1 Tax=Protea cynaroides TaxID=273540 RepID=A0A9Q0H769_9MAGN|nr:hypothetical protein NE237_025515 [Protea cynaroides]